MWVTIIIISISNKGIINLSTLVTYIIPSTEDYLTILFCRRGGGGGGGGCVEGGSGQTSYMMNTHFSKNFSENSPILSHYFRKGHTSWTCTSKKQV